MDTVEKKHWFTSEQITELLNHRYVDKVDRNAVYFSNEFKERFIKEYYDEGRTPREIFLRAGIDPDILGVRRVANISRRYRAAD